MAWFLLPVLTPIVLMVGMVAAERLEALALGGVSRASQLARMPTAPRPLLGVAATPIELEVVPRGDGRRA
ncbi:hypothetical protein [Amycolatopsis thermoflava]|uniref:hypothetical protein n=1 Tax=Amycolatopsis thermoflava TaxID=84480 RepID=UPI00364E5B99